MWFAGETKPFAAQLANRLGGEAGKEDPSLGLRAFLDRAALVPGDDADKACTRFARVTVIAGRGRAHGAEPRTLPNSRCSPSLVRPTQVMMKSLDAPVGVVLLDDVYHTKEWPVRELRRMMELLTDGQVRVLPVMYNMTYQELSQLVKRLSTSDDGGPGGGASSSDAAMLERLRRITMIHSNTGDVVRTCACLVITGKGQRPPFPAAESQCTAVPMLC